MARFLLPNLGRVIITNSNRADFFNHRACTYNNQHNSASTSHILRHNSSVAFDGRPSLNQNVFKFGRGSYVKVVSRQASSGTYHFLREFNDGENEHAHDVLCSIPAYKATTLNSKIVSQNIQFKNPGNILTESKWYVASNDELVETFVNLSSEDVPKLDNGKVSRLCDSLSQRTLSTDHILKLIPLLSNHESSPWIMNLQNSLDKACCRDIRKWSIEKVFLVADHWYALGTPRTSLYYSRLLQYIGSQVLQLTPSQLVQFLFYANINRGFEAMKSKHMLYAIKNSLGDISIEELGIITMGLFKTQLIIKDQNLNTEIIAKLINNIDIVSNHSLGSILKFLSKSFLGNAESQCYNLLDKLHPNLHRFNNLALLQVALLGNNLLVFHEGVIEKVGFRFGSTMSELRLKDIERFTYTLMLYKFIPTSYPDIIIRIINELRRPERVVEINHFPKCFVSCVNYLASMAVFPLDLISTSLQPSMLQLLESSQCNIGRELNELNWSLQIEGLDFYPGYKLDPVTSLNLTKNYLGRVANPSSANLSHQERLTIDVQSKLAAILGGDHFVVGSLILPHVYNPDLVFCTNREGEPVAIPDDYFNISDESVKYPITNQQQGIIWNAVILGGRNSYLRTSTEVRGNVAMKMRQLNKIGYRITTVPHTNYSKRSIKYKLACLERCLKETSSLNVEGKINIAMQKFINLNTTNIEEVSASNG